MADSRWVSRDYACLNDAYDRFCELLILAEEYFAAGDCSAAVALAQVAVRYAFPGHVGLFCSPRLEGLLLGLGKRIPTVLDCSRRRRNGYKRKILHVLSYGRPIGGDSRFVYRWMQEDRESQHSLAITTQADLKGIYKVPEVLRQSAEESGGFARTLTAPTTKPLEQAFELRTLCQEMDLVALHLFPYDIIPVLALAGGCDTVKTLYVNHADHTFWIGASVAHSVVHLRRQSAHFLRHRRGLCPEKSSILPIPLGYSSRPIAAAQAKHSLGYGPEVVLLVTIASPFKYSAADQIGFLDLVTPVLLEKPQAILLAVGPEAKGSWKLANIKTDGRIIPLGTRWDNDLLYAAADVYLDSVPFSSTTSLLEAGSRGVPLLGYALADPELGLLGPGAPGLDDAMEVGGDVESYRSSLARLISDVEFRRSSGQRVQAQILSLHTGSNWIRALEQLYKDIENNHDRGCLLEEEDKFETSSINFALVDLYGREPFGLQRLFRKYLGALVYGTRILITWRLHRKGFGLCLLNLLPPPLDTCVRGLWRWTKNRAPRLLQFRSRRS